MLWASRALILIKFSFRVLLPGSAITRPEICPIIAEAPMGSGGDDAVGTLLRF
jgi:hypothetical protein